MPPSHNINFFHRPYWCFISYRHADNKEQGRQWATWLHQQIETFEVPADLVGTKNQRGEIIPERIFPVFRDEEELPTDADLSHSISRALDRSLFLLVLCSPRAVASTYVGNEIRYFKEIGKRDRILAALIDGEPNVSWDEGKQASGTSASRECFPETLRFELDAGGGLDKSRHCEPIAADFRLPDGTEGWTSPEAYRLALQTSGSLPKREVENEVSRYRRQCDLAKLKILAGILGVPLGTLTKRDQAYQLAKEKRRARIFRRVAAGMAALAAAAVAAGIFAKVKQREAVVNQIRAESAEGEAVANLEKAETLLWQASYSAWHEAERSRASGAPQSALAHLAKGMENAPRNTGLFTFASSLIQTEFFPWRELRFENPVAAAGFYGADGSLVVAEKIYDASTRYSLWNLQAMERLDEVEVVTGEEISLEMTDARPWLKSASALPERSASESSEILSPGGYQKILFDWDGAKIASVDFPDHFSGPVPEYELPQTGHCIAAAWSADGCLAVTVHGILNGSERPEGRVKIWELRRPAGGYLLPDSVRPFGEGSESVVLEKDGDYEVRALDDGYEIGKTGEIEHLWKTGAASDGWSRSLHPDKARRRVLLLDHEVEASGDTGSLILEWRALNDGALISRTEVEIPANRDGSRLTVAIHPQGDGVLLLLADHTVTWTGDSEPVIRPVPGPRDEMGWANAVVFSRDGGAAFLGTRRKLIAVSWPDLNLVAGPRYHESMVCDIVVSDDGLQALSASGFGDGEGSSGYCQLWTLPDLKEAGPKFRHAQQISSLGFMEGGAVIITGSESPDGSDLRLWETKTALPLTAYLQAPPLTGQSFIAFESYAEGEIAALRADGEVDAFGRGTFVTHVPRTEKEIPDWFHRDFLPFVSGRKVGAEGSIEELRPDELRACYLKLHEVMRRNESDVYHRLLHWYFANPSTRQVHPWSDIPVTAYLETEVYGLPADDERVSSVLGHACWVDPSHPLLHLHLALAQEEPLKSRMLDYGLYRLTRRCNEAVYGREQWQAFIKSGRAILLDADRKQAVEAIDRLIIGQEE